jgi:tRNA (mo5U34)-methyltransferase
VSANAADRVASDARSAIAANPLWYHTIEVAPGVETPGWFDLRPTVGRLPWPDVQGKRCLDVGTYDGFLAFELERRGASEVIATDIGDPEAWDWPPRVRSRGVEYLHAVAGPEKGVGFRIAASLLGSAARLEEVSVYDLAPERVGEFDVVVCGDLLVHLRDPMGALAAMRSVCRGTLLCTNPVDLGRSVRQRRQPLVRLDGTSDLCQWWLPSAAGHRQMLRAGGFDIDRESALYSVPYGIAHGPRSGGLSGLARSLARRVVIGRDGVPHHAILAHSGPEPGQRSGER